MKKIALLPFILLFSLSVTSQQLDRDQIEFLRENAHWIMPNNLSSKGNWAPLDSVISKKAIVLLGEFNHETPEIFQIKNDLIKYLHENHGFNTILFESGIGELIVPNQQKSLLTPSQMTRGFFGYWRVEELEQLMAYVKKEKMEIAGFDVQRFGQSFEEVLVKEAQKLNIDTALYLSIEKRFGIAQANLTHRQAIYDSEKESTQTLLGDYETLLNLFTNSYDQSHLIKRTLENRIHYLKFRLQFLKDRNWNQRWIERDSMMAENVVWLLDNFYKNDKVIIYAHNFHIAKHNDKEEVMGEYLNERIGDKMYSVGFFAGSGTYGNGKSISSADSTQLDIKHIIRQLDEGVNFLNISQKASIGSEWLFQPIIVNDTFIDLSRSNQMTLSKKFDALIFIDEIGNN